MIPDYLYMIAAVIVVAVLLTRRLWINVARNAVRKRRIERLERIQETMKTYTCPLCGRSDAYPVVVKENTTTLECRNCHHTWTEPARDSRKKESGN